MAAVLDGTGGFNPEWVSLSSSSETAGWHPPAYANDKAILIVVGGWSPSEWRHPGLEAWLRRCAAGGSMVGAIGSAVHTLARAGLLNNHKSALHWETLAGFRERHSELNARHQLYSIDGKRFTCAGGTAVIDMMISLVADWYGMRVANRVAGRMLHANIRHPEVEQPMISDVSCRMPRQLKAMIRLMEGNMEIPLSISELADRSAMTPRHAQRLFHNYFGATLMRLYCKIRLEHARRLLDQTDLSITEIALASGFPNPSHFTHRYKDQFGITPHRDRISSPCSKLFGSR